MMAWSWLVKPTKACKQPDILDAVEPVEAEVPGPLVDALRKLGIRHLSCLSHVRVVDVV